ncbi:unnamed protein product [Ixodes persulcatus]
MIAVDGWGRFSLKRPFYGYLVRTFDETLCMFSWTYIGGVDIKHVSREPVTDTSYCERTSKSELLSQKVVPISRESLLPRHYCLPPVSFSQRMILVASAESRNRLRRYMISPDK